MADTPASAVPVPPNTVDPWSTFLTETSDATKSEDILYNDFFQENNNGELIIGTKKERSGLELLVSVLEYVTITAVITGILFGLHVYIRTSKNLSFIENYPILCPYLNYDINILADQKWCKSIASFQTEYDEKNKILEENILNALAEYIPIKVSSSILDSSPEKTFIINTYASKVRVNDIMEAFEKVKTSAQKISSQSGNNENITCKGITITNSYNLSTQCTILGGAIGNSDVNGQVGSSRIQAMSFIEKLWNTAKSSFIVNTHPVSLSIANLSKDEAEKTWFSTRTVLPIQVRYVPLTEKN